MLQDALVRKAYRKYLDGTLNELLARHAASAEEACELINRLIQHRERLREQELERLRLEEAMLLSRLEHVRHAALVSELACFKDVLKLHRKLVKHGKR
jgi:hypothetical protein